MRIKSLILFKYHSEWEKKLLRQLFYKMFGKAVPGKELHIPLWEGKPDNLRNTMHKGRGLAAQSGI